MELISGVLLALVGATWLGAEQLDAEVARLQAAVAAEPGNDGLRRTLIGRLIAADRTKAAGEQILALAEHPPDEWTLAWAQRESAHLAALDGSLPARLNEWSEKDQGEAADPFAMGMLAQLRFASERTGEALALLDAHVRASKESEASLRLAAATLETFGLYGRALEVFAALLRLDPENPSYLGAPEGWMAVVRDRREAWARVKAKLAAEGGNPFLHTLAGDYARELGDYSAALDHCREAVRRGGAAYAKLRLAEMRKTEGRWDEAAALYRQVAAEPDDVFISASHRSKSEANRRLAEVERGERAGFGNEVSIRMGEEITGSGLELVERSDSMTAAANIGGRDCRKTDSARGGYFFRFRVNDRFLFETDRGVIVEFDYFDDATGQGKCTVSYDSANPYGSWMPVRNGRDTEPACFYRKKSRQWKTAAFRLPRARFGNRLEDYTDFRIRSFGDNVTGGDLYVSEVRLRLADEVTPTPTPPYSGETRTIPLADLPKMKLSPDNIDDCRAERTTHKGERCVRLDYYFTHQPADDYAWVVLEVNQPLLTPPRSIGLRMDPNGSFCEAAFRIVDANGETFQMKLSYQMRSYGWTLVSRPPSFLGASWGRNADSVIDYPARLQSILIDTGRRGRDAVFLRELVLEE